MIEKIRMAIALFRYGLIAAVIHETVNGQTRFFKELAQKEHDVPDAGRKRYKVGTFKSWLRKYRKNGIDALKPKTRNDKGNSRKIGEQLSNVIKETIQKYPGLSCSAMYRLLISEGEIGVGMINEGTLRKYINDNNLKEAGSVVARKKYEKEHINELWIADCMHGPYIKCGKKKVKTFLIAIIDDMSRVIVGGLFFLHENSISLEIVLKQAIKRFGLVLVLYCDNGSIFVSSHLQLACARLCIALVHSKPYDSPSRGKIERFFRGVRQRFLPFLKLSEITDISQLNDQFERWLDKEYHKHFHHGIGTKPMDKFIDDLKNVTNKRVTEEELDMAFQVTIKRKVKNDATVSVNAILYECPTNLIGKTVQIRHPSDKPEELTIYENDKPLHKLNKVNVNENASPPAWEIKFNKEENKYD